MTYAIYVDSFTTLDDLKPRQEGHDGMVLEALRQARRFSIFDATRTRRLAETIMRLTESGRLETDNSVGYPWIKVVKIDGKVVAG